MPEEVLSLLEINPSGVYVDATLGEGGHAQLILNELSNEGRLIGIDCDAEALAIARNQLKKFEGKVFFINDNFVNLEEILQQLKITALDGILFDLGVSSLQLFSPRRGFSFRIDAPLDMRMDQREKLTAVELVNTLNEKELVHIFFTYGEERWSRRIAQRIVKERENKPLKTTTDLVNLIFRAFPPLAHRQKIHPATRIFQALRIAVNKELENLEKGLIVAGKFLKKGGRIVVISFHSLEDRIVKRFFRKNDFVILTPHPLRPKKEEIKTNPRARSARLRAAEKK